MKPLSALIKEEAYSLGFDAVGLTSVSAFGEGERALRDWIAEGRHGGMKYLEDFEARKHRFLKDFPDAASVIVLGVNYYYESSPNAFIGDPDSRLKACGNDVLQGRMARYAWGRDYHEVIAARHQVLIESMKSFCGTGFKAKSCVDIQPVPEKFAAARAGLGFLGKNTLLLSRKFGPWLFLSEIVTNLKLEEDAPDTGNCGVCTACQEICPTGALDKDYTIDARLCIAYLTIEHKGVIPRELRPKMKDWVFGCDECLTGCPFDSKAQQSSWPEFSPEAGLGPGLPLAGLFDIKTNAEYEKKVAGTAVARAGRKQLLRNACIVLGNSGKPEAIPLLKRGMEDPAPLVRLHAAWAMGQIAGPAGQTILAACLKTETDPAVLEEIHQSLTSRKA